MQAVCWKRERQEECDVRQGSERETERGGVVGCEEGDGLPTSWQPLYFSFCQCCESMRVWLGDEDHHSWDCDCSFYYSFTLKRNTHSFYTAFIRRRHHKMYSGYGGTLRYMNNSFVRYHLGICHVIMLSYSLNAGCKGCSG